MLNCSILCQHELSGSPEGGSGAPRGGEPALHSAIRLIRWGSGGRQGTVRKNKRISDAGFDASFMEMIVNRLTEGARPFLEAAEFPISTHLWLFVQEPYRSACFHLFAGTDELVEYIRRNAVPLPQQTHGDVPTMERPFSASSPLPPQLSSSSSLFSEDAEAGSHGFSASLFSSCRLSPQRGVMVPDAAHCPTYWVDLQWDDASQVDALLGALGLEAVGEEVVNITAIDHIVTKDWCNATFAVLTGSIKREDKEAAAATDAAEEKKESRRGAGDLGSLGTVCVDPKTSVPVVCLVLKHWLITIHSAAVEELVGVARHVYRNCRSGFFGGSEPVDLHAASVAMIPVAHRSQLGGGLSFTRSPVNNSIFRLQQSTVKAPFGGASFVEEGMSFNQLTPLRVFLLLMDASVRKFSSNIRLLLREIDALENDVSAVCDVDGQSRGSEDETMKLFNALQKDISLLKRKVGNASVRCNRKEEVLSALMNPRQKVSFLMQQVHDVELCQYSYEKVRSLREELNHRRGVLSRTAETLNASISLCIARNSYCLQKNTMLLLSVSAVWNVLLVVGGLFGMNCPVPYGTSPGSTNHNAFYVLSSVPMLCLLIHLVVIAADFRRVWRG
ncbi:hypothetical protein DQ04_00231100 [Trypanosoma grayi]|uniref:hypothetical protein n=1 Tax=Trypanosoma grayi TaxID=71804 RepID=UPI0004F493E3|nr:hypothetical protein DQ04_00231100 [Trypanosoma grayi]KEG14984.1 hypothetical protein DQ04_00231100 [Trypanosoma grayi]